MQKQNNEKWRLGYIDALRSYIGSNYYMAVGAPAKVIKRYDFAKHEWVKYDGE